MKKLLLFSGLLLLTFNTSSQCVSGDCVNGFGVMKFTDGGTYEGSFKDGVLDGFGYYYYPDGGSYTGEFKNNQIQGFGAIFSADGSHYIGAIKNGKQHGIGIFENSEGSWAYNWENGEAKTEILQVVDPNNPPNCTGNCVNGYGRITNADGSFLQAVFKNSNAYYGKIVTSTSNYAGGLKNNTYDGYGILVTVSGQYSGYFKNGKKHGKGITVDANNTKTAGDWVEGVLIDPTNFKLNQNEFEKELKELIALTKTERGALEVKEINFMDSTLEKTFLNQFEVIYDLGLFSDEQIKIEFPNKSKNSPTFSKIELESALKKCAFLTYNGYTFKQTGINILIYDNDYADTSLIIIYEKDYCISGDCKNGVGKKRFEDNYKDENGVQHYEGSFYEGKFVNDNREGNGKQIFANGDSYDGAYKNDKRNGKGIYNWKNGDVFDGQWIDNNRTGVGLLTLTNGNAYEGEWANGKKHGFGKFTWKNGDEYDGQWQDGKRNGNGKLTLVDGDIYEGEFVNGKFNGYGTYYAKDGQKLYEGNYLNNQFDGHGTRYYSDGKHVGEFKDNKRNGAGKLYDKNGKLIEGGYYKDDKKTE